MDQLILRRDLTAEFARRERAGRYLRVRATLRAEAARSATIGVSRRHWWWPWSVSRDAPQNLPEHLPWEADLGHLKRNTAFEHSENSVHHRPDFPAGAEDPAPPAPSTARSAAPSDNQSAQEMTMIYEPSSPY